MGLPQDEELPPAGVGVTFSKFLSELAPSFSTVVHPVKQEGVVTSAQAEAGATKSPDKQPGASMYREAGYIEPSWGLAACEPSHGPRDWLLGMGDCSCRGPIGVPKLATKCATNERSVPCSIKNGT